MEQGANFVERQQRRLAGRGFGEVAEVADVGADGLSAESALLVVVGHPRAAILTRTRKKVGVKKTDKLAVLAGHFIDLYIGMIDRKFRRQLKFQTEQAPGEF